jgi:hypothetical protein
LSLPISVGHTASDIEQVVSAVARFQGLEHPA